MKGNNLYNVDCVDGMRKLQDGSVDLVVTSPPYDNIRKYNGFDFDVNTIAKELFRVVKKGGVVVWVVGDATVNGSESGTSFRQALDFKEGGLHLHDRMIYEKAQTPFGSNLCYLQAFEYMFILSKGKPKAINFIRDRENKRYGVESMGAGGLSVDGKKAKRVRKPMAKFGKRKNIWTYGVGGDRKSTRLNSSHVAISYAVFCLKKKKQKQRLSVKRYRTRNRYMPQTYGVQITCTFRG